MHSGFYRRDSHRMMRIMWGDSKIGRRRAYIWLSQVLGYQVHFSTSRPNEIKDAHRALFNRMIKKNIDYLQPEKPVTLARPNKKRPNYKYQAVKKFGRVLRLTK